MPFTKFCPFADRVNKRLSVVCTDCNWMCMHCTACGCATATGAFPQLVSYRSGKAAAIRSVRRMIVCVPSTWCQVTFCWCLFLCINCSSRFSVMNPNSKVSTSMSTSSVESFQRRTSQKRVLHSDSSVSYQVSSLPPTQFSREESIKEIITRSVAYLNENEDDLETTTSRSLVHGCILVSIIITSLAAFICAKVRRCSSYTDLSNYEDCTRYFAYYSCMTVTSSLLTFLIYFLHLISQCDLLCLTERKYEVEILSITGVGSLLLLSSLSYLAHTDIFAESFTLASLLLSSVSVLLYLLRVSILAYEMVSRRRKRLRKRSQCARDLVFTQRSLSKENQGSVTVLGGGEQGTTGAVPVTKVITYVRNAPRKKTLSTSLSDADLEDDVFIQ